MLLEYVLYSVCKMSFRNYFSNLKTIDKQKSISNNLWPGVWCIYFNILIPLFHLDCEPVRRGRDRIVVWSTTTFAISAYHHRSCEFESRSWRGGLNITLCDKVCQWLATGRWFSPGTLVSSINKTNRHDITEILLKVALNTITPHLDCMWYTYMHNTPISI